MYRDQPHPCYPENRTEDGCYPENRNEEEGCYPQPPGGGRSLLERWQSRRTTPLLPRGARSHRQIFPIDLVDRYLGPLTCGDISTRPVLVIQNEHLCPTMTL